MEQKFSLEDFIDDIRKAGKAYMTGSETFRFINEAQKTAFFNEATHLLAARLKGAAETEMDGEAIVTLLDGIKERYRKNLPKEQVELVSAAQRANAHKISFRTTKPDGTKNELFSVTFPKSFESFESAEVERENETRICCGMKELKEHLREIADGRAREKKSPNN